MNKLYQGDCIKIMSSLPEDCVDMVFCDLPYGTTQNSWDSPIPFDQLWSQYHRIVKENGAIVLTAQPPFDKVLACSNLKEFKYEWIWRKKRTTGFLLANYRPMKQTEDIVVFSPAGAAAASRNGGNMTYNPQGLIEKKVKKRNSAKRLGKFLHNPEHMGAGNKLLHDTEYEQKYTNYPSEIIEFALDKDSSQLISLGALRLTSCPDLWNKISFSTLCDANFKASSTNGLYSTVFPGSKPQEAVSKIFALLSSILLANSFEAKPPKTTE